MIDLHEPAIKLSGASLGSQDLAQLYYSSLPLPITERDRLRASLRSMRRVLRAAQPQSPGAASAEQSPRLAKRGRGPEPRESKSPLEDPFKVSDR